MLKRSLFALLLSLFVLAFPALAQETQRVELYGGYSYVNIDTNNLTSSRENAHGWEASTSINLHRYFAIEGNVSGYYKPNYRNSGVDLTDYGFAGGPRLNYQSLFFHSLFGVDHLSGSTSGFSASQNSFALIEGGGVQFKVARHVAVRTSVDYVLTRHNVFGGDRVNQNNFRVGVGVVYSLGPVLRGRSRNAMAMASKSSEPQRTSEPRVVRIEALGISVMPDSNMLKIVDVDSHGAAARNGLDHRDYIIAVDGSKVQTPEELKAAIAQNKTGSIKLLYLVAGMVSKEREIVLK